MFRVEAEQLVHDVHDHEDDPSEEEGSYLHGDTCDDSQKTQSQYQDENREFGPEEYIQGCRCVEYAYHRHPGGIEHTAFQFLSVQVEDDQQADTYGHCVKLHEITALGPLGNPEIKGRVEQKNRSVKEDAFFCA